MGTNRIEHQEQSPAEVSKKLSDVFGIDKKELHRIWKEYNLGTCYGATNFVYRIGLLKAMNLNSSKTFDYLICLALETLNKEVVECVTKDE